MKNSKKAFSLVEILVALIIVSLITAALAPVITKKLSSSGVTITGGGSGSIIEATPDKKMYTVTKIGTDDALESDGTTSYPIGNVIDIVDIFTNVKITYISGAGGSGGVGGWKKVNGEGKRAPSSQADCAPYNAIYFNNSCITKANVGDVNYGGAPIENLGIHIGQSGNNANCQQAACCWIYGNGGSAKGETCIADTPERYGTCKRTVCTWQASNLACNSYTVNGSSGWSLPTKSELEIWKSAINSETTSSSAILSRYLYMDGINLCDDASSGYGSYQCTQVTNCEGSHNGICVPAEIWAKDFYTGQSYHAFLMKNGTFSSTTGVYYWARSARCVLHEVNATTSYSFFAGGGGASAAFKQNIIIPDNVISSNVGGKIYLETAPETTSVEGVNSSLATIQEGRKGLDGTSSKVWVVNPSGVTIWGIEIVGGLGGNGATSTSGGRGASSRGALDCKSYNASSNSWVNLSCTNVGVAGLDGATLNENENSTPNENLTKGGDGAGSAYISRNPLAVIGGGTGGNRLSISGGNATVYGAGGGGGSVAFNEDNTTSSGASGKGGAGVIEITYYK